MPWISSGFRDICRTGGLCADFGVVRKIPIDDTFEQGLREVWISINSDLVTITNTNSKQFELCQTKIAKLIQTQTHRE